ncbi:MAG: hypothetical protein H8D56_26460 [Planctomycetes bacterium]|nr:hypothetical protein [Planctomycetota bacterium]
MNITIDMTSNYKILNAGSGQKTKPIQTQFKPNLTQNKANLSQFKAKTNPICRKGKNEFFYVDMELKMKYCDFLAKTYHPKGCQSVARFLIFSWTTGAKRLKCYQRYI